MDTDGSKKLHKFSISDGGKAGERRTHADVELERALRALFFAMRGRDGKSLNMNFRNVAAGKTNPWRVLMRRFREAKAARNDTHNYPLMKESLRELDRWVDVLHGKRDRLHVTGEHKPAA